MSSSAIQSPIYCVVLAFSEMMDREMLFYKGLYDHKMLYYIKKAYSIAEGMVLPLV